MGNRSITRSVRRGLASALMAILFAGTACAEWVGGEVRLDLRIDPGANSKIITTIATGDPVTVLGRDEESVHVRIADGREGWIPAGFLVDEVPTVVDLRRSETELSGLREGLKGVAAEVEKLRSGNETLVERNEVLNSQNRRLETENHRLRAGTRWPEWIAGASILAVGMLMGAIFHAWTSRRSHSRVRL